ncbi:MAG: chemotaxis protein CheD [Rhodocyclaceae bacterium]|nr:chemotaxis protein CheD [Rhodocyclaceae bacterium]
MTVPINPAAIDIFLQPGEVYFGDRGTRIRTVLGSCVSITFWHPRLLLGGMCHIMLPGRIGKAPDEPDGRYADEAVSLLVDEMRAAGTQPRDYQAKLFGGGRMFDFADGNAALDIGGRNVEAARRLLRRHGLDPVREHLAGVGHRSLVFDVASGDVWVKHMPEMTAQRNVA